MIVHESPEHRPESRFPGARPGWTSLHSWIFLAIVAVGLAVVGIQNRYHYLSPLGLGKAYRIDKLFGGIQEFDPAKGWIKAQLQTIPPPPPMSMMEPPAMQSTPAGVAEMPSLIPKRPVDSLPGGPPSVSLGTTPKAPPAPPMTASEPANTTPTVSLPPAARPQPEPESTPEQRWAAFKREFPDYGKDEFQLANDDLYPDWKKNHAPDGTWRDFLEVYKDFVQWWQDNGSPPEPGFKLWKDFMASRPQNR